MSSLAQEESRSISENVTRGQRKRFADGKVNLPYKQFLGYRKGADGFPEVVPEEAIVVHRIYTRFMEGSTPGGHCKGTDSRWGPDSIEKTTLADQYSGKHPSKREIQGRCTPSEMLHGRFPHKKRGRSMRARCRSIMWNTAMSRSLRRKSSTKFRRSLRGVN